MVHEREGAQGLAISTIETIKISQLKAKHVAAGTKQIDAQWQDACI